MNKKTTILISITGILALLLTISITYAYFKATITGDPQKVVFRGKDNNLKVYFRDSQALNEDIEPGWEETKTFEIENESAYVYEYDIIFKDLINEFVTEGFLQYKITSDNGYNMSDYENIPKSSEQQDIIIKHHVPIEGKATQTYTVYLRYRNSYNINQSEDMGATLNGKIEIQEGTIDNTQTLFSKILADNPERGKRTSFSTIFTGKAGLYEETDDKFLETEGKTQDTVYYFAGEGLKTNNWVKFGKEGTEDIWWRIIRTNEDGSVRLLYVGKGANGHNTTSGYISTSAYNETYTNTMYVGYKYGTTGSLTQNRTNGTDSDIKKTIDKWYDDNMKNNDIQGKSFSSYLSRTAIYCNDRSTKTYSTGLMWYGAAMRLTNNASGDTYGGVSNSKYHPTFKCGGNADGNNTGLWENGGDAADKFTGSQQGTIKVGNQLLGDKPIALMTADEVSYAGGAYSTTSEKQNGYFYQNSSGNSITGSTYWWTMSPCVADNNGLARVFSVRGSGSYPAYLDWSDANTLIAVRPVLSLKSCVEVTSGNGTVDSPYEVSISNMCAIRDN